MRRVDLRLPICHATAIVGLPTTDLLGTKKEARVLYYNGLTDGWIRKKASLPALHGATRT